MIFEEEWEYREEESDIFIFYNFFRCIFHLLNVKHLNYYQDNQRLCVWFEILTKKQNRKYDTSVSFYLWIFYPFTKKNCLCFVFEFKLFFRVCLFTMAVQIKKQEKQKKHKVRVLKFLTRWQPVNMQEKNDMKHNHLLGLSLHHQKLILCFCCFNRYFNGYFSGFSLFSFTQLKILSQDYFLFVFLKMFDNWSRRWSSWTRTRRRNRSRINTKYAVFLFIFFILAQLLLFFTSARMCADSDFFVLITGFGVVCFGFQFVFMNFWMFCFSFLY